MSAAELGLETLPADKLDRVVPARKPIALSVAQVAFLDSLDTCRT